MSGTSESAHGRAERFTGTAGRHPGGRRSRLLPSGGEKSGLPSSGPFGRVSTPSISGCHSTTSGATTSGSESDGPPSM